MNEIKLKYTISSDDVGRKYILMGLIREDRENGVFDARFSYRPLDEKQTRNNTFAPNYAVFTAKFNPEEKNYLEVTDLILDHDFLQEKHETQANKDTKGINVKTFISDLIFQIKTRPGFNKKVVMKAEYDSIIKWFQLGFKLPTSSSKTAGDDRSSNTGVVEFCDKLLALPTEAKRQEIWRQFKSAFTNRGIYLSFVALTKADAYWLNGKDLAKLPEPTLNEIIIHFYKDDSRLLKELLKNRETNEPLITALIEKIKFNTEGSTIEMEFRGKAGGKAQKGVRNSVVIKSTENMITASPVLLDETIRIEETNNKDNIIVEETISEDLLIATNINLDDELIKIETGDGGGDSQQGDVPEDEPNDELEKKTSVLERAKALEKPKDETNVKGERKLPIPPKKTVVSAYQQKMAEKKSEQPVRKEPIKINASNWQKKTETNSPGTNQSGTGNQNLSVSDKREKAQSILEKKQLFENVGKPKPIELDPLKTRKKKKKKKPKSVVLLETSATPKVEENVIKKDPEKDASLISVVGDEQSVLDKSQEPSIGLIPGEVSSDVSNTAQSSQVTQQEGADVLTLTSVDKIEEIEGEEQDASLISVVGDEQFVLDKSQEPSIGLIPGEVSSDVSNTAIKSQMPKKEVVSVSTSIPDNTIEKIEDEEETIGTLKVINSKSKVNPSVMTKESSTASTDVVVNKKRRNSNASKQQQDLVGQFGIPVAGQSPRLDPTETNLKGVKTESQKRLDDILKNKSSSATNPPIEENSNRKSFSEVSTFPNTTPLSDNNLPLQSATLISTELIKTTTPQENQEMLPQPKPIETNNDQGENNIEETPGGGVTSLKKQHESYMEDANVIQTSIKKADDMQSSSSTISVLEPIPYEDEQDGVDENADDMSQDEIKSRKSLAPTKLKPMVVASGPPVALDQLYTRLHNMVDKITILRKPYSQGADNTSRIFGRRWTGTTTFQQDTSDYTSTGYKSVNELKETINRLEKPPTTKEVEKAVKTFLHWLCTDMARRMDEHKGAKDIKSQNAFRLAYGNFLKRIEKRFKIDDDGKIHIYSEKNLPSFYKTLEKYKEDVLEDDIEDYYKKDFTERESLEEILGIIDADLRGLQRPEKVVKEEPKQEKGCTIM